MSGVVRDLRFAIRQIAKTPGFSAAIVLSLALAIGANAAIFSLVNTVVLASVQAPDADRLVALYTTDVKNPGHLPVSDLNGRDIQEQASEVLDVTAYTFVGAQLDAAGDGAANEVVPALLVRGNYFGVLGIEPELGRLSAHRDAELGAHPEVVLSYALWQERFGGDPGVIGTPLRINGHPLEVVGVTPEGFRGTTLIGPGLFIPYSAHQEVVPQAKFFGERRFLAFFPVGRLAPGASIDDANAELARVGANLARAFPAANEGRSFTAVPVAHSLLGPDQRDVVVAASAVMLTVVGFILLIACANAANLLLARAAARRGEVAVRQAVGATPGRIVRQLLTESLLLAGLAMGVGLAIASPLAELLWGLRPVQLPIGNLGPELDPTVLLYTTGLAVGAGVLFGLAPALRSARLDLVAPLKEETTPATAFGRRGGVRSALVILQVALSTIALAGAGLFLRSMDNARHAPPGFDVSSTLLVDVNLGLLDPTPAIRQAAREDLARRALAVPGVQAASTSTRAPFAQNMMQRTVYVDGTQTGEEDGVLFEVNHIGPGLFGATGQPMLDGREFDAHDGLERDRIAIVNEAFAARYWPDGSAVGRSIRFMGEGGPIEIVGLVATAKVATLTEDPVGVVYVPHAQWPQPFFTLHVRVDDPEGAMPAVMDALAGAGSDVRANNPRPMQMQIETALFGPRVAAILLGALGALGLALAIVGLFGVMTYSVRQRTREIGIRMALGARPSRVRRLVLLQATPLVGAGLALGLAGTLVAQAAIAPLLFEVPWGDPVALGGAALILGVCALLAAALPAFAATRISPERAIRHD